MAKSKLIGKKAYIKESSSSWLAGGYGIITDVRGDVYYIAPWGDDAMDLCFAREEFVIRRGKNAC